LLKFIEKNWRLPAISARSRDNLPNPIADGDDEPYEPRNGPAIGDLMNLFTFSRDDDGRE
jgi:phospholipase C